MINPNFSKSYFYGNNRNYTNTSQETILFTPQQIGDSDNELSDDGGTSCTVFQKKQPIKAKVMTIQCKEENGSQKNIKGSMLIKLAHDIVKVEYESLNTYLTGYGMLPSGDFIEYPVTDLDTEFRLTREELSEYYLSLGLDPMPEISIDKVKQDKITICRVTDWILTLGNWKGMMPRTEIKDSLLYGDQKLSIVEISERNITFKIISNRIHIPELFKIGTHTVTDAWKKGERGQWIKYQKNDLSYNQINKAVNHIKQTYHLSDTQLANLQLKCLRLNSNSDREDELINIPQQIREQIIDFFHYLNCLMFGIEPSGLNAGFLTGLITIDLIIAGRINYEQAFNINKTGNGIYPFANPDNGAGTYNARVSVIDIENMSMKEYRINPNKSPTAVKEAILIKYWLKIKDVIDNNNTYKQQMENIRFALGDLLDRYTTYNHLY